jgi:hypothetical protein
MVKAGRGHAKGDGVIAYDTVCGSDAETFSAYRAVWKIGMMVRVLGQTEMGACHETTGCR